jgi:hypothetical protein
LIGSVLQAFICGVLTVQVSDTLRADETATRTC